MTLTRRPALQVTPDAEALERLAEVAFRGQLAARFEAGVPVGCGPASRSSIDALGALVAIAVTARLDGLWPQLKICAESGCGTPSTPRRTGEAAVVLIAEHTPRDGVDL